MDDKEQDDKAKRDRSPSYPSIPLETAITRLTALDEYFKRHPAPFKQLGLAWGMKIGSSQASSTVAALKSFGLVEYQGSGDDLKIILSDDGRTYLRAQQDEIKRNVLLRSALKPKAIAKYWIDWGAIRPPDPVCLDELVLKAKFSQAGAENFLKVYDATISYARLAESDKIANKLLNELSGPKIGDFVQWQPGGVLQFPEPRRVTSVSESGDYVTVEGSATGLPLSEVSVVQPNQDMKIEPLSGAVGFMGAPPVVKAVPGVRQDIWNLDEGTVMLQYPAKMSAASFEDFEAWINLQLKKIKRGSEQ